MAVVEVVDMVKSLGGNGGPGNMVEVEDRWRRRVEDANPGSKSGGTAGPGTVNAGGAGN